jgi:predicted ester cyclase
MNYVLPAIALFVAVTACHPHPVREIPEPSTAHAAALQAFQDVFERAISQRDTAALLRSVAPELTMHVRGEAFTAPRGALWQLMRPIVTAFPDIHFHVEEVVAESDRVAARLTFTGTSRAPWHDLGPTGRRVQVSETFLCRLVAGQLRECWQEWDEAACETSSRDCSTTH